MRMARQLPEAIYKTSTHSIDIIVSSPSDFNSRSDSVSTIEKTISGKGVVLYG